MIHLRIQPMDLRTCAAILEELVPMFERELRAGAVVSVREDAVRVRRLPVVG